MIIADYSTAATPTLAEQRDALQKGLGRAVLWAQSGQLADEPLLDACLHDKRFDMQCENKRGEWLWGILGSVGAVQRLRGPILEAVRHVTLERDAYQLCDVAFQYAKTGDSEFKASLYDFVERKPIADCPWIGEGTLLELGGEEAFRFIARIRGRLLETRPWDWDNEAIIGRAVEKFGEPQVRNLLNDPADSGLSRFAAAWREEMSQATTASRQSHAERMRAITFDEIMEAITGNDKCFWLRGWGMHADEAAIGVVLGHLRVAQEPGLVAKLLRVFWNRALPEFEPRLIELCRHADSDVRRSAFNALKCNTHPLIRAFGIAELEKGVRSGQVVSLFINNYEQGDEHRIADAIELPDDSNELHWLLMDVVKVLEKYEGADCSRLGLAAYALTPCGNCRADTARLLYNRHAAPRWLIEECRREHHCLPVALVFDLPEKVCQERNRNREDRDFGPHVIRQQRSQLRRSIRGLKREGFSHVFIFETPEEVEAANIERVPLWNDKRDEHGPFDIIGDLHGCCDELETLLVKLGYEPVQQEEDSVWGNHSYRHPEGRKVLFLGDLVDRGPRILDTLRLVRNMVADGVALCVPGNHDVKFMRMLQGRDVQVKHGLAQSVAEVEALPEDIRQQFATEAAEFLDRLVSHYVLDGGKLVVAHAGMKAEMQGRGSGKVREFALYGETTGETDEFGLPIRYNWAAEYRGRATVVYGHTPVPEPEWLNRTTNIDTGCVFGGKLTALRWPERECVSVPAARTYCEPARPFLPREEETSALSGQQILDDLLDADDVLGKRIISTRLRSNVTIREENAMAALEVMSRFAANPKWLIYLPPTMSPCETTSQDGFLEHPTEAFAYYRSQGVPKVVCEQKHMGSRAVMIVCRDEEAARQRFGVVGETGIAYTRTGRRFFGDDVLESQFLGRIQAAMKASGFWEEFKTTWACLDCELMPWSAKAQELLRSQYAAVGASGRASLPKTVEALRQAAERMNGKQSHPASGAEIGDILHRYENRCEAIGKFVEAYRHYCWPVQSLDDLKLAPFHLLATEGKVHTDQNHLWHLEMLAKVCRHDTCLLLPTPYKLIDLADPQSEEEGTRWWLELTEQGGEGMVVKPQEFVVSGLKGLVQPAVKCRGPEYLRIIYGPEYTFPDNLNRLRERGLATKRSLALREFALGIEALERFAGREPLRRVHECVFGVLALESEPVDPRL